MPLVEYGLTLIDNKTKCFIVNGYAPEFTLVDFRARPAIMSTRLAGEFGIEITPVDPQSRTSADTIGLVKVIDRGPAKFTFTGTKG